MEMDDEYQYHITMVVCSEQEDAIRTLFKDRDWPCWLNVLSEQMVEDLRKCGHDYIFSDDIKYDDETGDINAEFVEIKSEVVDVEDEMETESLNFTESPRKSKTTQDPAEKPRKSTSDYTLPTGSTSRFPTNPYMVPMTSGFPTPNYNVPRTSGSFPLNYLTYKAPPMPSTDNVATGLPASGYISDLVTNDVSNSMYQQRPRRNINYNNTYVNEYWKDKGIRSAWNANSNVSKTRNEGDTDSTQDEKRQSTSKKQHDGGAFRYVFCTDCCERFITREELWKHRNDVEHALPESKPTGQMKRNFSPEELEKLGFVTCTFCTSYFPNRRKLRQHYFSTHREKMPTPSCPVCAEEFETYKELLQHKREKEHNDSLWRLNSYQCDRCGKHITKYENFKRHKLLTCGKSESELEALRVHPCEVCGKRFMTLQAAKHHISVVHETSETICDICGKVCKSKFALRGHKLRHNEKNRKFICEDCGKGFFTTTLLKQHMRCHTKEKPFKCPLCDYTCSIPGNVHKHSRNVHKQDVMPMDLRESKQ